MDGTPRPRTGAWPNTPQPRDRLRQSDPFRRQSPSSQQKPLPQIPTLKTAPTPPSEPLIPTNIIEAPTQRLYAFAFWAALLSWRLYDYTGLQESDEQSLWLFMKWVAIDGVFLFGLPGLRIPWLEWNSATMTLIFLAHAIVDAMLMFRIPIPIAAGLAVLWRGVWGASETAVNEYNVNPESVLFNDSLILGRQIIHILPEGSAVMNPEREAFCIDHTKPEIKIPITINATEPIGMDIVHVDLDTQLNSTLHITKSQLKQMHKEASRLLTYSDHPDKPKTLYYTVKKPGLYALAGILDASNLQVSRKNVAHTVVVPCPRAEFVPTSINCCKGEVSEVQFEAIGTPPMKVKYRKVVNRDPQHTTFENIQPDDFFSPLLKADHNSLVLPKRMDTEWAKTRSVRVPLSEGLTTAGSWIYAIDEIVDGFGNRVSYTNRDQAAQEKKSGKHPNHLHQMLQVHERPVVNLAGCTPQRPMKVAKGRSVTLPVQYGSTGRGSLSNTSYHLDYIFSAESGMTSSNGHSVSPQTKKVIVDDKNKQPQISDPGLYTLTGVSSDFCVGEILEPATCLLQNPPEPELKVEHEDITDQCAKRAIGLLVHLDMAGTPPFEVSYKMVRQGDRHHTKYVETVDGLRGQIELTPRQAGKYSYEFESISDAVYKDQKLPKTLKIEQTVHPSASASFVSARQQTACIDHAAAFQVQLSGEGPFDLEYELLHNGKRKAQAPITNIAGDVVELTTPVLSEGGEWTVALVSITDGRKCKEFLRDEAKISVRHQKPKAGFGLIEARRIVDVKDDRQVPLPLRLTGEGPWTVKYVDGEGDQQTVHPRSSNDRIEVNKAGMYELVDVSDSLCPGLIDDTARSFQVNWIPRPELRVSPNDNQIKDTSNTIVRSEVCEGDEDAVEVLFKGAPPYTLQYIQSVKPEHGAVAPKTRDLRAALNVATLRMETSIAGTYEYKFAKLTDHNYDHDPKHWTPVTIKQKVNSRPSAAFTNPGKTYSFCSVESEGEEVIPVTLHGQPPFAIEVEIKHHGTVKPEIIALNDIKSHSHNIRINHSKLHLGKSAISLRRVSDARGCSRSLDSTTPRVQISVHDAPSITSLEERKDYCVGDRINFGLSGVAPFTVFYTFNGQAKKATVASGNTFRRLAEKPGEFVIIGLQDSASSCRSSANIPKQIHGMPSVRVSKGKEGYIDIHEGGQAEILFEFGGTPPFQFTYTRSANTDRYGKKSGEILDMRAEESDEYSMRIWASEEGTYEVVSIKDAHCSYTKPGVQDVNKGKQKKLGYY